MKQFEIKVPATSANLGLGFDSLGLALNKFLTIRASVSAQWSFVFLSDALQVLPTDEQNLVAKVAIATAERFYKKMPPLKIEMDSEIPLTHGLGSSSSAIVAGIELANEYCQLNLSEYDKILIGTEIEGHPDNVGPCVTGDLFIGSYHQQQLFYEVVQPKALGLIVTIPPYELSTQAVRKVLPQQYDRGEAVGQNALSNVMIVALMKGDYEKAGQLMMQDYLHEPYRQPLIEEFATVKQIGQSLGAYASVISGSGPTILTLVPTEKITEVMTALMEKLSHCAHEVVEIYSISEECV